MKLKPKLFKVWKRAGETPLQTITRIREQFPDFLGEKMTYAGRLDPLAEGVLLILVGEECKNKEEYLGRDKEYEVEFLLGIKTDTGDVMGMVMSGDHLFHSTDIFLLENSSYSRQSRSQVFEKDDLLTAAVTSLLGKKHQIYPKYSSPRLCGKEGTKEVEIKEIELLGQSKISSSDLLKNISEKISAVRGDFRQTEIIEQWNKNLISDTQFIIIKCRVACTSGTYIRVLAEELGEKLGTTACVYSLKRTKVGEIKESDCVKF